MSQAQKKITKKLSKNRSSEKSASKFSNSQSSDESTAELSTVQVVGKSCVQSRNPDSAKTPKVKRMKPKDNLRKKTTPSSSNDEMSVYETCTSNKSSSNDLKSVLNPMDPPTSTFNEPLEMKLSQNAILQAKEQLDAIYKMAAEQIEQLQISTKNVEKMPKIDEECNTEPILNSLEENVADLLKDVKETHKMEMEVERIRQTQLEARVVVLESQLAAKDELENELKLKLEELTRQVDVLESQRVNFQEIEKSLQHRIEQLENELKIKQEHCQEELKDAIVKNLSKEQILEARVEISEEELSQRQTEWLRDLSLIEELDPILEESPRIPLTVDENFPEELYNDIRKLRRKWNRNLDWENVCKIKDLDNIQYLFNFKINLNNITKEIEFDKNDIIQLGGKIAELEDKLQDKQLTTEEMENLRIQLSTLEAEKAVWAEQRRILEEALQENMSKCANAEALYEETMERIFAIEDEKQNAFVRNRYLESALKNMSLKADDHRKITQCVKSTVKVADLNTAVIAEESNFLEEEPLETSISDDRLKEIVKEQQITISKTQERLQQIASERDWLNDEKDVLIKNKEWADDTIKKLTTIVSEKELELSKFLECKEKGNSSPMELFQLKCQHEEAIRQRDAELAEITQIKESLKKENEHLEADLKKLTEERDQTRIQLNNLTKESEDRLAPLVMENAGASTSRRTTCSRGDDTTYLDLPSNESSLNSTQNRSLQKELQEVWSDRLQVEEQLAKALAENQALAKQIAQQEAASRKMAAIIDGGVPSAATWLQLYNSVKEIVGELTMVRGTDSQDCGSKEQNEKRSGDENEVVECMRGEPEGGVLPPEEFHNKIGQSIQTDSVQNPEIAMRLVEELVRYLGQCEEELNISLCNESGERLRLAPDLSELDLSEISRTQNELDKCLKHVKTEASRLLTLSRRTTNNDDRIRELEIQLAAADNQVKNTRRFLEEQAAEREFERDEFQKKLVELQEAIRSKDKLNSQIDQLSHHVDTLEHQLQDKVALLDEKEQLLKETEASRKDAIDKIWTLRDIIQELENQVTNKGDEIVLLQQQIEHQRVKLVNMGRICEELESVKRDSQSELANQVERLQEESASLRMQLAAAAPELIQSAHTALHDLELGLAQRTREIELALIGQASNGSGPAAAFSSASEELSHFQHLGDATRCQTPDEMVGPCTITLQRMLDDSVDRLRERFNKHRRAEEALMRKTADLEIKCYQLENVQIERDVAVQRIEDQLADIAELNTKIDQLRTNDQGLNKELEKQVTDLSCQNENLSEELRKKDEKITDLEYKSTYWESVAKAHETTMVKFAEESAQYARSLAFEEMKNKQLNDLAKAPDVLAAIVDKKNTEIDDLRCQLSLSQAKLTELEEWRSKCTINASGDSRGSEDSRKVKFSVPDSFVTSISSVHAEDSVERCAPIEGSFPIPLAFSSKVNNTFESAPSLSALQLSPRGAYHDLSAIAHLTSSTFKESKSQSQSDSSQKCNNCQDISGKLFQLTQDYENKLTTLETQCQNNTEAFVEKLNNISKESEQTLTYIEFRLSEKSEQLDVLSKNFSNINISRQLAEMGAEMEMKNEELNAAHSEITNLRSQLKLISNDKDNLQEQIAQLQEHYRSEVESNAETKALNSCREMELEATRKLVTELEAQLLDAQRSLNSRKSSAKLIEEELQTKCLNLNDLQNQNEQLLESNSKLHKNFEDVSKQLAQVNELLNDARSRNEQLFKEIDVKVADAAELRKDLVKKSADFVSLQKDFTEFKQQLHRKIVENQDLLRIIEELNLIQKDLRSELKGKYEEIEDLQSREKASLDLSEENRKLQEALDKARLQSVTAKTRFEESIDKAKSQLEENLLKITLLEANLEEERIARMRLARDVDDLQQINCDLNKNLLARKEKCKKLSTELNELREHVSVSSRNQQMFAGQAADEQRKAEVLQHQNDMLNDKLLSMQAEINRLNYQAEGHALELRAMTRLQQCEAMFQPYIHSSSSNGTKDRIMWQRAESYRKALIWQKRYLTAQLRKPVKRKRFRKLKFREVVFTVIAIHRMRFLVKRWKSRINSALPQIQQPNVPSSSRGLVPSTSNLENVLPKMQALILSPPSKDPGLHISLVRQ